MRISRKIIAAFAAVLLSSGATGPSWSATAAEADPAAKAAYDVGMAAYERGDIATAKDRLGFAADHGVFYAEYYLARLLNIEDNGVTDHGRAYDLYLDLADAYRDVDAVGDKRAAFVARADVEVAKVLQSGLSAHDIAADPDKALEYLEYAANYFNDADAQFELAKAYLSGKFGEDHNRQAIDWLSLLSEQKAHPGAQAYLGDLFWRGQFVDQRQSLGLALVMLATENAGDDDRIWIEDSYQRFFCAASPAQRKLAASILTRWHQRPETIKLVTIAGVTSEPPIDERRAKRSCGNGELLNIAPLAKHSASGAAALAVSKAVQLSTEESFTLDTETVDTTVSAAPLEDDATPDGQTAADAGTIENRSGPIFGQ